MPVLKFCSVLLIILFIPLRVWGEPSMTGQTGLLNMPDARIEPDGTWRIGVSNADPYLAGWSSVSVLPFLEVSGRYTRIKGVPGFAGKYAESYGDYKDKSFDVKLIMLNESEYLPALAVGAQDFQGTGIFSARYLTASKRFDQFDVSMGVGSQRIDGLFGGVRYHPAGFDNIALVAEYDANDYARDINSQLSGAAKKKKGGSYGLEYKWGWLGLQASYQHSDIGLNGYIAIPLDRKDFIPKLDEPEPYVKITPRPTLQQWLDDPSHRRRMVDALYSQDFKNIRVHLVNGVVEVTLTNARISQMSRAVGRAARTVLLLSPLATREIRITYTASDLPVATYTFFDVNRLQRYFNGMISRKELAAYVALNYAAPAAKPRGDAMTEMLTSFDEPQPEMKILYNDSGDIIALQQDDRALNKIRLSPKLAFYFNDPSGAFRYDIFARASYDRHLTDKLFLSVAADATLLEDVSKVDNPSNSLLPHVRSDVAEYKKGGKIKINRALLNKYYQPSERVYARASAGIYEEMYAGAGGQLLYLPQRGPWAADLSVDWLKQRDFSGVLSFRDYSTVTALGALHYRLPMGMTATARAGKFLAQDLGTRFEFKRRFPAGFEMGAWYTLTNGNDITTPGAPGKPYHDKGIFLSMPLSTMLTKDTQSRANFALSPWSRDVGQMVASPGDLYDMLENPLLNMRDHDGMVRLGDVEDDYNLPSLGTSLFDRPYLAMFQHDAAHAGEAFSSGDVWNPLLVGVGATVLSSLLDKPADRWAKKHAGGRASKSIAQVGKALPFAGAAVSGLFALDDSDARLSGTAVTAIQAGALAALAGEGGKFLAGRSRPLLENGSSDFHPLKSSNGNSSFPSLHAAVAWAVVTPYAKEYEMPWLYGVAALTNVARVADRKHWVSDTVGGALVGYALGNALWQSHRKFDSGTPKVSVYADGVSLSWDMP